jgi:hypothetical protein
VSWRINVSSQSWLPATNTWRERTTLYGPYLTYEGAAAEVRAAVEHHRETAEVAPMRVVASVEAPAAAHVAEVATFRFYPDNI